jgi:hypothetical protein
MALVKVYLLAALPDNDWLMRVIFFTVSILLKKLPEAREDMVEKCLVLCH